MLSFQAFLLLFLTVNAFCTISGRSLVIGMKPRALQMSHRPVSAFIGVNKLSKQFESFLVDIQGEYKSNFNTLTENAAVFVAVFTALSTAAIPYTIIKAGHVYGHRWAATVGGCMVIGLLVTSPVWTKPLSKRHTSSAPVQLPLSNNHDV